MRAVLLVAGLMFAQAAEAQMPVPGPAPTHRAGQAIGDQVFIAPSGEPFRAPRGAPYPTAAWFASADINHDGRISQSEFTASFARFFDSLDSDHDGMIRSEEIQRYEKDIAPEVRSFGSGFGGDRRRSGFDSSGDFSRLNDQVDKDRSADVGKSSEIEGDLKTGPMGAGRFALINIPEPISAMDTDFNGIVSRSEMLSAARRRFALLDPQGKGGLTMADLPQTWAQSHPRGDRDRDRRK